MIANGDNSQAYNKIFSPWIEVAQYKTHTKAGRTGCHMKKENISVK